MAEVSNGPITGNKSNPFTLTETCEQNFYASLSSKKALLQEQVCI